MRASNGGVRQKRMSRNSYFHECYEEAKKLFFPSGRNKKGKINHFSCKLMSFDGREELAPEIESDVVSNIDEYVSANGLKLPKFVFTTRELSFLEKMKHIDDSSSSDDDVFVQRPLQKGIEVSIEFD